MRGNGVLALALASIALCLPSTARARMFISEVMYDAPGSDTAAEWVEIRNDSAESVELSKLKLADSKGAHKIVPAQGGAMLMPGSFAIVARNPATLTAAVPVFKSAMSLGNTSGTIELRSASGTLDTATYSKAMGAAGDGNTLNRASPGATFVPRAPSPGAAMSASAIEKPAPAPTAPKKKSSRAGAKTNRPSRGEEPARIVVEGAEEEREAPVPAAAASVPLGAAAAAGGSSYEWPLAAGALAAIAGIGVAAARRAKRNEWTIIDDTPNDA
ncbi:lamin tail domain-containing protein [Candidatus Kaiserbacteria bacterium]|nr:lamin tail domain-containing protein [Candidatus Kaiserbacteria bacterium]